MQADPLKTEPRRTIATVTDYNGLIAALRARATELQVTFDTIDEVAGLPTRYSSKILRPIPIRTLSHTSLGCMLGALGLALVVIEDLSALRKIESRLAKRLRPIHASDAMPTRKRKSWRGVFRGDSEWGKLMAARRVLLQTPEQRSNSARKAARARWRKLRKNVVAPMSAFGQ